MIKHETITKILEHGLSKGADFTEVFVEDSKSSSFNLLDRKIDQIQSSNSFGIGIRLLFGDEAYYGYSSDPDEANLIKLTGNLAESGNSGPSTDPETLEKQSVQDIHHVRSILKPCRIRKGLNCCENLMNPPEATAATFNR